MRMVQHRVHQHVAHAGQIDVPFRRHHRLGQLLLAHLRFGGQRRPPSTPETARRRRGDRRWGRRGLVGVRRREDLLDLQPIRWRYQVIVAAALKHLAAQRLERRMSEEDQPTIAGQVAKRADGQLRPALDRLGGGEDRGVPAIRTTFPRQLSDSVEHRCHRRHLGVRQHVRKRGADLLLRVADEEDGLEDAGIQSTDCRFQISDFRS